MNKESGILLGIAALGAGALLLSSRDASAEGSGDDYQTVDRNMPGEPGYDATKPDSEGIEVVDRNMPGEPGYDATKPPSQGTPTGGTGRPGGAPVGLAPTSLVKRPPHAHFESLEYGGEFAGVMGQFLELISERPSYSGVRAEALIRPSNVSAFQRSVNEIRGEYMRSVRTTNADVWPGTEFGTRVSPTAYEEGVVQILSRINELFISPGCGLPPLDNVAEYETARDARTDAVFSNGGVMSWVHYNQSPEEISAGRKAFSASDRDAWLAWARTPVQTRGPASPAAKAYMGRGLPSDSIGALDVDGEYGPCTQRAQLVLYNLLANAGLFDLAEDISGLDPSTGRSTGAVNAAAVALALTDPATMYRFRASVAMLQVPDALNLPLGLYNTHLRG